MEYGEIFKIISNGLISVSVGRNFSVQGRV